MIASYGVVIGWTILTLVLAQTYFRRFSMQRPPVGVMTWIDAASIVVTVVAAPFVYLALPAWAAALLIVPSSLGLVYFTLEPIGRRRAVAVLAAATLIGLELTASRLFGQTDDRFLTINDVIITVIVVGIGNLWVQSGMRASHVAAIAGALSVYDLIATSQLPLMADFVGRIASTPLVPFVAWTAGGHSLAIGVGDLVVAVTFTLAVRKAYGRSAGIIAIAVAVLGVASALALLELRVVERMLPAMVVIGPACVLQYLLWRGTRGRERSMRGYLDAEPIAMGATPAAAPSIGLDPNV